MNKVTFPLEPPMQGAEVENLQNALQAFIDHVVILKDNEPDRIELSAALHQERLRKEYNSIRVKKC